MDFVLPGDERLIIENQQRQKSIAFMKPEDTLQLLLEMDTSRSTKHLTVGEPHIRRLTVPAAPKQTRLLVLLGLWPLVYFD